MVQKKNSQDDKIKELEAELAESDAAELSLTNENLALAKKVSSLKSTVLISYIISVFLALSLIFIGNSLAKKEKENSRLSGSLELYQSNVQSLRGFVNTPFFCELKDTACVNTCPCWRCAASRKIGAVSVTTLYSIEADTIIDKSGKRWVRSIK